MRFRGFLGVVAVCGTLGCGAANATTGVLIHGSGKFGDGDTTLVAVPGAEYDFSFLEPDPVDQTNPFGGSGSGTPDDGRDYLVPYAGSFQFSIDGTPVMFDGKDIGAYLADITFYNDRLGGGFDIDFSLPGNLDLALTVYGLTGQDGVLCDASNPEDTTCTPGTFKLTNIDGVKIQTAADDGDQSGDGTLTITATTIEPPATSAVPEPATWAMMVGGFGLVGAAARRRRALTAIA